MRVMITGRRTQQVRRKLNRNCEARFGIRGTPPRLGPPTVTVLFEGNARVLPALDGPKVPLLKPPSFNP
jgi:hypothetical protein